MRALKRAFIGPRAGTGVRAPAAHTVDNSPAFAQCVHSLHSRPRPRNPTAGSLLTLRAGVGAGQAKPLGGRGQPAAYSVQRTAYSLQPTASSLQSRSESPSTTPLPACMGAKEGHVTLQIYNLPRTLLRTLLPYGTTKQQDNELTTKPHAPRPTPTRKKTGDRRWSTGTRTP